MKAIQVKYLPTTNHKPSRWKAFVWGGASVTNSYDHALNGIDNAERAALDLIAKMKWDVVISGSGQLANEDYVFTLAATLPADAHA